MPDFAKIFTTKDYGQILVMLDQGDDCEPEVQFKFMPPPGTPFGLATVSVKFNDSEIGAEEAQAAFDLIAEDEARGAVAHAYNSLKRLAAG
ncbi:MAG: hypothetical protein CMB99_16335 [Flavobacteriaceae bacterium]|nr:hypothetical protein [Flavobacteriaceae bacterium]|tara:strand:- start:2200 stop:2472 length:273 start_codon:yes stop_codon:yes gene_type:complete